MRKIMLTFALWAAIGTAVPGSAVTAGPTYDLAMVLSAGGTVISRPQLVVAAGEPAEIVIVPGDGASYRATVAIDRMEGGRLHVSSAFAVASAATGTITALPQLVVTPGETFTVEFGNSSPPYQPFRADLTISPTGR